MIMFFIHISLHTNEAQVTPVITVTDLTPPRMDINFEVSEEVIESEEPEIIEPEIIEQEVVGVEYSVPAMQNGFKSWMPGSAISKTSIQGQLLATAIPDEQGLYRIDEHYVVAVGTFYSSTIGDIFEITLSTGHIFTIVVGDIKDNRHTDSMHQFTVANGCMTEFIVYKPTFRTTSAYYSGDISSNGFEGTIVAMKLIGNINDEG